MREIKKENEEAKVVHYTIDNMVLDIMTIFLAKLKYVQFTTRLGINQDDNVKRKKERQTT